MDQNAMPPAPPEATTAVPQTVDPIVSAAILVRAVGSPDRFAMVLGLAALIMAGQAAIVGVAVHQLHDGLAASGAIVVFGAMLASGRLARQALPDPPPGAHMTVTVRPAAPCPPQQSPAAPAKEGT